MKRGFIFSAGSFYGLRERPEAGDFVIAADAGYRICQQEGLVPDLVLGDFDSMEPPEDIAELLRAPVEKDDTDTLLAVKTALARGCEILHIYGGTGGARLDHTVANFQTLLYIRRQGARGYLHDANFVWTVIEDEAISIQREIDWGLCSVFCLGARAEGVCERGLQYSLTDAVLEPMYPIGVSNHFVESEAVISVRRGALLIGWERLRRE